MDQTLPKPKYSFWQGIAAIGALAERALLEVRELARLPGPPGEKGERGPPGFKLSDFSVTTPDDGRTLVFMFAQGKDVQTHIIKTAIALYRGVWSKEYISEHGAYEKGDMVTRDGSIWYAKEKTMEVPANGAKDWKLSVKRGSDGKQGPPGLQGSPGRNGHDLTQMAPDGRKF